MPIINQVIYLQAYLASGMAESPCQNILWHHQSMNQSTYSISPHSHLSPGNLCIGFTSLHSFLGTGSPLASLLVVFSAVVFSPVIFFTAVFSATSFVFLAFLSAFFLALSSVLLAFSSAFCFYICSVMAFFSSCSFLLCSYCSVASCFWDSFSSSSAKHSALVRRCAHGRAF